jgi:sensor histidine kinase YesM
MSLERSEMKSGYCRLIFSEWLILSAVSIVDGEAINGFLLTVMSVLWNCVLCLSMCYFITCSIRFKCVDLEVLFQLTK